MSKTAVAYKKDSPDYFNKVARKILHDYMRTYYPEADIIYSDSTALVYQTDFFKYSVIETSRHLSTHFYRYMIFEMQDIDSGLVLVRFPMPPTHKKFLDIMHILDIK